MHYKNFFLPENYSFDLKEFTSGESKHFHLDVLNNREELNFVLEVVKVIEKIKSLHVLDKLALIFQYIL